MHYPNDELIDDGIFVTVAALKDHIFRKDCGTPSLSDYDAWQHWQRSGAAKPERKRRERKPTLAGALKQASKVGVNVKSATLAADGSVSLTFGNMSGNGVSDNPWDEVLINAADQKRPS